MNILYEISQYFPKASESSGGNKKVELGLSNYAARAN